jgi:uncharacterized protein YjiS (DUF1127 family)
MWRIFDRRCCAGANSLKDSVQRMPATRTIEPLLPQSGFGFQSVVQPPMPHPLIMRLLWCWIAFAEGQKLATKHIYRLYVIARAAIFMLSSLRKVVHPWKWLEAQRQQQRAYRELMALDDSALADIGITRANIPNVVFGCKQAQREVEERGGKKTRRRCS